MKASSDALASRPRRRASSDYSTMRSLLMLIAAGALSACALIKPNESGDKPTPASGAPVLAPALPDKGDPQARFDAALQQWKQNDIAEAEASLKSLVEDFPEHSGPWANLGILYAKSNRRQPAIAALSKAATLNPKNDVAFNWLGILNREAGDFQRARLAYEKALDANPESALAHYNLAILLDLHLKQPQAALPHYASYQRLSGKQDLKVLAWVAEIEAALAPSEPPAPTVATDPKP